MPLITDPSIIDEEKRMSDFNRAYRIYFRYIGIDPYEWDKYFTAFRKKQKEENKLVINKEHEAMTILEENLTEAIRAEMTSRYVIKPSH